MLCLVCVTAVVLSEQVEHGVYVDALAPVGAAAHLRIKVAFETSERLCFSKGHKTCLVLVCVQRERERERGETLSVKACEATVISGRSSMALTRSATAVGGMTSRRCGPARFHVLGSMVDTLWSITPSLPKTA